MTLIHCLKSVEEIILRVTFSMWYAGACRKFSYDAPLETMSERLSRQFPNALTLVRI